MISVHESTERCLGCWRSSPLSTLTTDGLCPDCRLRVARVRFRDAEQNERQGSPESVRAREELVQAEWPSPND